MLLIKVKIQISPTTLCDLYAHCERPEGARQSQQSHLDIHLLSMINKTRPFIKEGIINTGGRHEKSWDHFHPYQFYLYNL